MNNKFNIGDFAWYACHEPQQKQATCPDCLGQKYLTVILADQSQVTIDCGDCASGYDPPRGYVTYWEHAEHIKKVLIDRVEIKTTEVEYGFCGNYRVNECDLFSDEIEAETRARQLAAEWNEEQIAKISRKEKDTRSWAWCVAYHRRAIKEAQRQLEYHTAKLDAAKNHVK